MICGAEPCFTISKHLWRIASTCSAFRSRTAERVFSIGGFSSFGSGTRGLPQWCSLFRARKVATPKQIAEATIGSERVPLGVDRQEDEVDVS